MSLDLNYKPNVFVETASLTEDEWLAWRRKGVGGSDVAAALGLSPYTQRCRFSPPKASRFAICRSTFHRFCTVRTFCNVLLNPHFREINAAVFHILNIGDQTVCSCSIQCFYADSQYTGCFFPCNQFIHRLLRHPFGICPVFFSLLVPECNIQVESLQLHQSHASAPYLPAQDSESRISCRRCRAVLPIP